MAPWFSAIFTVAGLFLCAALLTKVMFAIWDAWMRLKTEWDVNGRIDFETEVQKDRDAWEKKHTIYLSQGLLVFLLRRVFFLVYYFHQYVYLRLLSFFGPLAWRFVSVCLQKEWVKATPPSAVGKRVFDTAVDLYCISVVILLFLIYLSAYWLANPGSILSKFLLGLFGIISAWRIYDVFGITIRIHTGRKYFTPAPIRALFNTMFHYCEITLAFAILYLAVHVVFEDTFGDDSFTGSWIAALYFSLMTIATVGYGDFTPQTIAGRWLVCLEIMLGLVLLVIIIQRVLSAKHPKRGKKKKRVSVLIDNGGAPDMVVEGAEATETKMDQCANCHAEVAPHTDTFPRGPCPRCGATPGNIRRECADGPHTSDAISWEQSRPGTQSTAKLYGEGQITLTAFGPSPKNEEDGLEMCARLVRKLNREGAHWSDPVEGEQDIDGWSHDSTGKKLKMQVVRASNNERMWSQIGRDGMAVINTDLASVANEIMASIRKKGAKYGEAEKRVLTLILDAGRTPSHTFQNVLDVFGKTFGEECKATGFAAIWSVGSRDDLVVRLDA